MIIGGDIDNVLYKACKKLKHAQEYSPRGQKTKELIQETLIIQDSKKCITTNPARKLSREYLDKELEWYLAGDKNIEKIAPYASMWSRIADENNEVNSNYGEIIFKQELENYDGSQFDWVINSLEKDRDSRQAVINFNQPKHKREGVLDMVCTLNTQYVIRNNNLIAITNMRSNDLIYGFGNDFPFFSYIHQQVQKKLQEDGLEVKLGMNIHTVGSLHVYEKHFPMVDKIIEEYEKGGIISDEL